MQSGRVDTSTATTSEWLMASSIQVLKSDGAA